MVILLQFKVLEKLYSNDILIHMAPILDLWKLTLNPDANSKHLIIAFVVITF